ncbi:MAG: DUF1016 family protein [Bacilli bacterium]|nr:DUF1016 family protein [Bacilli bacterium]
MNYYNEIKNTLIKNETYKKVKDYSKNRSDLNAYFEVGRLLIEAQGGEKRAQYGNQLIKDFSKKLSEDLIIGYSERNLRNMRTFYLKFQKWQTLSAKLSWSHYLEIIKLKNIQEIKYYTYISEMHNLSVRELRERIKSKEYERIGYKEELKKPKINTLIKNPIIINTKNSINDNTREYTLHQLILDDMERFLKELGNGFTFYGHEVSIKIGNNNHRIDFLLFNVEFNCYIVIEIKVTKMKAEYIGQVKKYMNYVDKNMKKDFHENTVGIIICKKEDKYVLEYCSDNRIFTTTYELARKINI